MKRSPYLYFLSNTKATTEQGELFGVHFVRFHNTCSKYSRIKLFTDDALDRENLESFVPWKFKRIRYHNMKSQLECIWKLDSLNLCLFSWQASASLSVSKGVSSYLPKSIIVVLTIAHRNIRLWWLKVGEQNCNSWSGLTVRECPLIHRLLFQGIHSSIAMGCQQQQMSERSANCNNCTDLNVTYKA